MPNGTTSIDSSYYLPGRHFDSKSNPSGDPARHGTDYSTTSTPRFRDKYEKVDSSSNPGDRILVICSVNTKSLTLSIPDSKLSLIRKQIGSWLRQSQPIRIRELARIIGTLVTIRAGTFFAPLYMRALHINQREALRAQSGNYNKTLSLTSQAKQELRWWYNNIQSHWTSPLTTFMKPCLTIITDASPIAWGGILTTPMHTTTRGDWTQTERKLHINHLELLAIKHSMVAFAPIFLPTLTPSTPPERVYRTILIQTDNTTAMSYINRIGINTLVCTDRDSQEHMDLGSESQIDINGRVCSQRCELSGCSLQESRQLQLVPTTDDIHRGDQTIGTGFNRLVRRSNEQENFEFLQLASGPGSEWDRRLPSDMALGESI